MTTDNKKNLTGAGGGKSGGGTPTEVKDNQFSNVVARVLTAYSSGTTGGLIDGNKSIFLNETRLQALSGDYNFEGVFTAESDGTGFTPINPPAEPAKGTNKGSTQNFTSVTSTVNVSTQVEFGTPVVRTVSSDEVDAVRIIMTIPALQEVEEDGDIKGTEISLTFEVRDPGSGMWEDRGTKIIQGKSSGPFQRAYRFAAPDTVTAAWDWRVIRNTADSASARLNNDSTVQAAVELFYGTEDYLGTASIGIEFATEDFGNTLPSVSFEVSGVLVQVPTNYTLTAGIPDYDGVWDGLFKFESTSNPVWHLFNLITNDEIGLGLDESFVDRFNFYEAARYCDAVDVDGLFVGVDDGDGGVRRRFTFNTQITGQQDGIKMLQEIAASCRAILYFGAGAVVLKQDAPRATARIVTNDNVKDGIFAYSTTQAKDRITVAKVGYNDPDDFFKLRYSIFPKESDWAANAGIIRFGRNELEVIKLGCANEAEAFAFAQWIVYTSINEDKTATFIGGPEFILSRPGDVIEIADRRLAGAASLAQRYGGRIAGGAAATLVLDFPIDLAMGETYSVTIVGLDGIELETRNVTNSFANGVTTLTVDADWDNLPTVSYTWLVTGTDIAPQKFSIINVERKEGLEVEIFAVIHDENKFAAVESGIEIIPKPYTKIDVTDFAPPTNMTFQLVPRLDAERGTLTNLLVGWDESTSDLVTSYRARWRRDNSNWNDVRITGVNELQIDDVTPGDYDIQVFAVNALGYHSVALGDSFTVAYDDPLFEWEGGSLTILPPTFTSGPTFSGKDMIVTWTRDAANDVPGIVFKQYVIEFYDDVGGNLKRTVFTSGLETVYYYDDMVTDQGTDTPSRDIEVRIREQDALQHESADAIQLHQNLTPAGPTFVLRATLDIVYIDIVPSTDGDLAGYMVFRDTTMGFTPAIGNLIYKGPDPSITDSDLDLTSTYYYVVAAFDLFDEGIPALTLSSELSITTGSIEFDISGFDFVGIEITEASDVVSWTAGTVYQSGAGGLDTIITTSGNDTWTSGSLFIYYNSDSEDVFSTTSIVTALTSSPLARILATYDGTVMRQGSAEPIIDGADIIAGTVGASQVVTSGLITLSAQINNAVIETANIKDLNVTTLKIGGLAVTTAKIDSEAVTEAKIGGLAVTEAKIDALAVTSAKIDALAVTTAKIDALAVTEAKIGALAVTSAKIDALAVTTAKIGDLQVETAKIGDLQVEYLKIGENAATESGFTVHSLQTPTVNGTKRMVFTDSFSYSHQCVIIFTMDAGPGNAVVGGGDTMILTVDVDGTTRHQETLTGTDMIIGARGLAIVQNGNQSSGDTFDFVITLDFNLGMTITDARAQYSFQVYYR